MRLSWGVTGETRINLVSDQHLVTELQRGEASALGSLYDRYGCLVFTLACSAGRGHPDAITEEVFWELWKMGARSVMTEPLLTTLLRLTADVVARQDLPSRHSANAPFGQPRLPALAPFAHLPSAVFDILVLTCLGRLTVDEVSVALNNTRPEVLQHMSSGFTALRASLQKETAQLALQTPEARITMPFN